ncbi:ACP S-malonyltransferase [Kibdelosporangium philippinense]|uniref:Malonyl CoA-acyl carrier protein transacylase n=1 Tax=Kibdelosporangium philippinense TaxID=211113 RepID=A0ABS8Z2F5_9PSEU|nr:ACP S-malonyltransferase [Kibdelosporangium philippinense]MCE7002119.1 ACP S-malonyltransferase [Kibdelosporangium philippinense]
MTALLFAGQGSERVGMGAELTAACAGCRDVFAAADEALSRPLSRWIAQGPEDVLRSTEIAQPALLTVGVAQGQHLLALGIKPVALVGHSLGQYTALVTAGALNFSDAVRLVAARGQLMQQTVPRGAGAMVAVSGLSRENLEVACKLGNEHGVVGVACFNAPDRAVLSGETNAVAVAADVCEDAGGGVVALPVSAPFHSALLAPMVPKFARLVAETPVQAPRIPVVDNVTAQPLGDADAVRKSLVDHIERPVLFDDSLRTLAELGVQRLIGCGPGIAGLTFASRTIPDVPRVTFEETAAAPWNMGGAHAGPV